MNSKRILRFRPLVALVRAFRKATPPPTLPADTLSALCVLRTAAEWPALLAFLDEEALRRAETLLHEDDALRNAALRGAIVALRELPLLIERTAKAHEDARDRGNAAERNAGRRADARSAALYASPGWPGRPVGDS